MTSRTQRSQNRRSDRFICRRQILRNDPKNRVGLFQQRDDIARNRNGSKEILMIRKIASFATIEKLCTVKSKDYLNKG